MAVRYAVSQASIIALDTRASEHPGQGHVTTRYYGLVILRHAIDSANSAERALDHA